MPTPRTLRRQAKARALAVRAAHTARDWLDTVRFLRTKVVLIVIAVTVINVIGHFQFGWRGPQVTALAVIVLAAAAWAVAYVVFGVGPTLTRSEPRTRRSRPVKPRTGTAVDR